MATELKGDFIGFSFDGIRSEGLGLVRVSSSDRYTEDLNPTTQDSTTQVPGGDGFYYFGSYHTQKTFSVPVAFDRLTEKEFARLRRVFVTKGLHKLIFDEQPYKYYVVKCNNPQLKYLCFTEGGQRIYKGEGTLNFVAYFPYGKSVYKYLSNYSAAAFTNKSEWAESSRMINSNLAIDQQLFNNKICTTAIYNAGDLEADFYLNLLFSSSDGAANSFKTISLIHGSEATPKSVLILADTIERKDQDVGLRVNTKTNLIEGLIYKDSDSVTEGMAIADLALADVAISAFDSDGSILVPSGNLYNEYIVGGDFFKIPTMEIGTDLIITTENGVDSYSPQWKLTYSADTANSVTLEYDYLYY